MAIAVALVPTLRPLARQATLARMMPSNHSPTAPRKRLPLVKASVLVGVAIAVGLAALVALPAYTWYMIEAEHVPATEVLVTSIPVAILLGVVAMRLARLSLRKWKASR